MSQSPTVVIFSLAPLKIGGIERGILQWIEKLGHQYAFHVVGPVQPDFEAGVAALPHPVGLHKLARFSKFDLRAIFRLADLFKSLGAEVVHTVEPRSRILGHLAARRAGAKAVHTFQIAALSYDDLSPAKERFYRFVEGFYNRRISDHIIFVSGNDRKLYEGYGLVNPETASVVYNSADLSDFVPFREKRANLRASVRADLGLPEEAMLASTVGRLAVQKGLDYLIEAVAQLFADPEHAPSDWYFPIAGGGELHDELTALARERGVEDRVIFLGFMHKEAIYELLFFFDMFVLPSRFECFPFSIVEAMAADLPCIVTDVGGNSESVEDGYNGLVVPKGDVPALAAAIRKLAADAELRQTFSHHARLKVPAFSTDKMAQETGEIYASVLQAEAS